MMNFLKESHLFRHPRAGGDPEGRPAVTSNPQDASHCQTPASAGVTKRARDYPPLCLLPGLALAALLLVSGGKPAHADCTSPAAVEGELLYNYDFHVLQYCNGTGWVAAAGGGNPLSSLVGAIAANTFDNLNFSQNWIWSTLTTGNALSLSSSTLTSGRLISASVTNAASTGSAIYGSNTSATGYGVYSNGNLGVLGNVTISGTTTLSALSTAGIVTNNASGLLSTTATLPVGSGGTGIASYAVGDLLYASGATTLAKLADVATGNALISGGVGVAPSWGKIALGTHVSGTLPVANGGTGLASWTTGSIPFASAATTLAQNNANLFWDNSNARLGLGTAAPATRLQVNGVARFGGEAVGYVDIYNQPGGSEGGEIHMIANNGTGYYLQNFSGSLRGINSARSAGIWSFDQSGNLSLGSAGNTYLSATGASYFNAGNVGIGATPDANVKLMLSDAGQVLSFLTNKKLVGAWPPTAEANTMTIQSSGATTGNLAFATGNNEVMRVTSGGNVGIGTAGPSAKLHVSAADGDGILTDAPIVPTLKLKRTNSTTGTGNIDWIGSGNAVSWRVGVNDTVAGSFAIKEGTSDASTRLFIATGGNIGINTSAPNGKLEIANQGNGSGDGLVIGRTTDNTAFLQGYIDGQWAARTTYAGACCNGLLLQPDVGYVAVGGPMTINANASGSGLTISGNLNFTGANPNIASGGSYITIPNGLFVNGGTPYFANEIQARGGIHNDSAAYLTVAGGTSGHTYFSGNVGIGTTGPATTLQVNGTVLLHSSAASLTAGFNGEFGNPSVGGSGGFRFNRNSSTAGEKVLSSRHANSGHEFYHEILSGADSRYIFNGGNVGIGTTAPSVPLHVAFSNSSSTAIGARIVNMNTTNSATSGLVITKFDGGSFLGGKIYAAIDSPYSWDNGRLTLASQGTGTDTFIDTLTLKYGNVGIGTITPSQKLDVVGNITASAYYYSSDESLKKNIETLGGSLDKVRQLRGVSFNWKEDGRADLGVIAQEVEKIYPQVVITNKNTKMKAVEYGNLIGPLIEAVKELAAKFTGHDKRIEKLENENADLKKQLNSLAERLQGLEKATGSSGVKR